jgi:hypothetical protein
MRPLVEFLLSPEAYNRGVRIVGPESTDPQVRAPTISFVVVGDKAVRSPDVVKKFDELGDVRFFTFDGSSKLTVFPIGGHQIRSFLRAPAIYSTWAKP